MREKRFIQEVNFPIDKTAVKVPARSRTGNLERHQGVDPSRRIPESKFTHKIYQVIKCFEAYERESSEFHNLNTTAGFQGQRLILFVEIEKQQK